MPFNVDRGACYSTPRKCGETSIEDPCPKALLDSTYSSLSGASTPKAKTKFFCVSLVHQVYSEPAKVGTAYMQNSVN